jgi:magnesium transporter
VLPTSAKAVITMRDMRTFRPLLPRRAADPTRDSLVPEHSMAPHPTPPTSRPVTAPIEASVVNSAVYRDGVRIGSPSNLAEALRSLPDAASMAWIGMYRPSEEQLLAAAEQFGLHELAIEDAIVAHQRPKLERYGDTLFVVLRAARYVDETERVDFGELHVFCGPTFVLTVRHSESPDLSAVRSRMEHDPELLRLGPEAVLYAILDAVVDGYAPVVAGLQNDIDEIETEVFSGDPKVSRRIYELTREVIEFQRATKPLLGMLSGLSAGFEKYKTDEELQRYLRDVTDHATTVVERADGFRQLLGNILTVNATLVSQTQNEEMSALTQASYAQNEEIKKVSAWAAILFAPTLIGTVYGMNFDNMPELHWAGGYPFALGLMALICAGLYTIFKRRGWL